MDPYPTVMLPMFGSNPSNLGSNLNRTGCEPLLAVRFRHVWAGLVLGLLPSHLRCTRASACERIRTRWNCSNLAQTATVITPNRL